MAVAETWFPTSSRTYLYARPDELGQVFDFALLKSPWDRDRFRDVIRRSLLDHGAHANQGGGLTWVLSSHDVPRHASRLALPVDADFDAWLLSHGTAPRIDIDVGIRRARAATLMMLDLPGSAYIYQGEELGLPEPLARLLLRGEPGRRCRLQPQHVPGRPTVAAGPADRGHDGAVGPLGSAGRPALRQSQRLGVRHQLRCDASADAARHCPHEQLGHEQRGDASRWRTTTGNNRLAPDLTPRHCQGRQR